MATPVSGTDGGEGSPSQRGESSDTVNTLTQRLADVSLVHPPRQLTNWGNVVETLNLYVAGINFPEVPKKKKKNLKLKNGQSEILFRF